MAVVTDRVTEAPCAVPPPGRVAWFHALVSGQRQDLRASLARVGLSVASVPYGFGIRVRNRLFDWGWKRGHRAAVPVVSIGNLTLGGTGKTPAVEYIASFYRGHCSRLAPRGDGSASRSEATTIKRVAILSRGYGAEQSRNDEALVLEENLPDVPHLQGADRVELAQVAVAELESEVLALDDGFQHRRLHRDLDIVLVDATNPWGFNRLFPRGLLREPKSSLRRADLVLLTRCDQIPDDRLALLREEVERLAPGKPIVESSHAPTRLMNGEEEAALGLLATRPVAAFCGIGNPEGFQRTLERLTERALTAFAVFPDHHAYTRADVDWLRTWAQQLPADAVIVTTQKDLVKLRLAELADRPLWALQIALTPTRGHDALDRMLEGILS